MTHFIYNFIKNDKDDVIADVIPIAMGNAQGSQMGIWWWTSIPSLDFLRWELRKLWPVEVFSIEQRAKWQRWRHSWRHTHRHGKPPRPQGWFMVVNIHTKFGLPTMGTLGDTECDILHTDTSPNEYIAASGSCRCCKNWGYFKCDSGFPGNMFTTLNGCLVWRVWLYA